MVDWLIARGARVNGWKHERHRPVHVLVERRPRSKTAPGGAEAVGIILEAILKAGADPDAPWDNGLTMLMRGGVKSAEILLAHGADPKRRDRNGQTALHHSQEAAKVRLLVAHGADINALSTPAPPASYFGPVTPLQRSLQWGRLLGGRSSPRPDDLVPTLLELGADPKRPDGSGRDALWYCHTVDDCKLMLSYCLDPKAQDNLGNTLLHQAVTGVRIAHPNAIGYFKFLLGLGLDINATNNAGQTILHVLAAHEVPRAEDVRLAIESGADRQIKDARGRRPYDVTPKSKTDMLAVLQ
jgi:ankyrin repeat protein